MRRLLQRLVALYLRVELAQLDYELHWERQRVQEWPQREAVWLRRRSWLASRIDRLRCAPDLVRYTWSRGK